jgi:hypothetical protein
LPEGILVKSRKMSRTTDGIKVIGAAADPQRGQFLRLEAGSSKAQTKNMANQQR